MEKNYNLSLLAPFSTSINTIKGIKFSSREIDILACILGGRTTKKIASFLLLSPKTVENYIRNITLKLECNSRENVIDFIEQSDKLFLIKDHYSNLLIQTEFEKSLKEIFKLSGEKTFHCLLLHGEEHAFPPSFIPCLQRHLGLAGLTITVEAQRGLSLFSEGVLELRIEEESINQTDSSSKKGFFLLLEKDDAKDGLEEVTKDGNIEIIKEKNYYFLVLYVLQKLLVKLNLERIILEFKKKYETFHQRTYSSTSSNDPKQGGTLQHTIKSFIQKRKWPLAAAFAVGGIVGIGFFTVRGNQEAYHSQAQIQVNQAANTIRSDLILPTKAVYLDRPELMAQIEEKLKGQGDIQTVALVGVGGAGKTTLARKVAHAQSASLIWEINAETKESLTRSFEDLAQALTKTEEEKKILKEAQAIQFPDIKNNKILLFVKELLKEKPNWFLLYDNVENLMDIHPYVPQDEKTWGRGKVLITTRNRHIQNNNFVHVLPIDILTPQEKLDLFTKIMANENLSHSTAPQSEIQKLLEDIPPFPLDVSVAAYYLKTTQVSPEKYREHLKTQSPDFIAVQENILHETGQYIQTRYGIITLSLEQLMKIHKDFEDLLLMISLLDAQKIPRALLEKLKDTATVDRFLYHLKKYSLMTDDPASVLGVTFSLHRSMQEISHAYLVHALNTQNDPHRLNSIAQAFETYLTEIMTHKYCQGAEGLVRHSKILLGQEGLSPSIRMALGHLLGRFYCYLGRHQEAKGVLEKSFEILQKLSNPNEKKLFETVTIMGEVYRELGQYEKAQQIFEQYLKRYQKSSQDLTLAQGLIYLGNLYRDRGQYEKAEHVMAQSLAIYENVVPKDLIGITWAKASLGAVYRELGRYREAMALLEQGLPIYKKHLPENHKYISWILLLLGRVYEDIGEYKKARTYYDESLSLYKKQPFEHINYSAFIYMNQGSVSYHLGNMQEAQALLENSLALYQKRLPETHPYILNVHLRLGLVYQSLHQREKAKDSFEKAIKGYEQHYGKDHQETAWALRHLGQLDLQENYLQEAEELFSRALSILQKHNQPRMYFVYEDLADLSHQKQLVAQKEGKKNLAESLQTQSVEYLKKGHDGMRFHFPETSAHLKKILLKLKKLETIH